MGLCLRTTGWLNNLMRVSGDHDHAGGHLSQAFELSLTAPLLVLRCSLT